LAEEEVLVVRDLSNNEAQQALAADSSVSDLYR